MKLYTLNVINSYTTMPRVVAKLTGQTVEVVKVDAEFKKSAEFLKLSSTDQFPLLETKEGGIQESTAIAVYFC
jgi:glutathione S-transferase